MALEKNKSAESSEKKDKKPLFPKRAKKKAEEVRAEADLREKQEAAEREVEKEEFEADLAELEAEIANEDIPEKEASGGETEATKLTEKEMREAARSSLTKSADKLCSTYAKRLADAPPNPDGKFGNEINKNTQLFILKIFTGFGATGWIENLMETDEGEATLLKLKAGIGLNVVMEGDKVKSVEWIEVEGLFPEDTRNILARAYGGEVKATKGALKDLTKDTSLSQMKDMVGDEEEGNNLLAMMEAAGATDNVKVVEFLETNAVTLKANPNLKELPKETKLTDEMTADLKETFGDEWEADLAEIIKGIDTDSLDDKGFASKVKAAQKLAKEADDGSNEWMKLLITNNITEVLEQFPSQEETP